MNVVVLEIVTKLRMSITLIKLGLNNWALNDIGSSLINSLNKITEFIQSIAVPGATVCAAAIGVLFFMGKSGADKAKPWMMYVLIGIFVIFGAAEIANFFKTSSGF